MIKSKAATELVKSDVIFHNTVLLKYFHVKSCGTMGGTIITQSMQEYEKHEQIEHCIECVGTQVRCVSGDLRLDYIIVCFVTFAASPDTRVQSDVCRVFAVIYDERATDIA